jgi:hypothetical protein
MYEKHFQYWAALTAFSLVSLISLTNKLDDDNDNWQRAQRWALSVTAISLAYGAISCCLHLGFGDRFAGTVMELGVVSNSQPVLERLCALPFFIVLIQKWCVYFNF